MEHMAATNFTKNDHTVSLLFLTVPYALLRFSAAGFSPGPKYRQASDWAILFTGDQGHILL